MTTYVTQVCELVRKCQREDFISISNTLAESTYFIQSISKLSNLARENNQAESALTRHSQQRIESSFQQNVSSI